jgi:lysophospholipase L1-like esterase
MISKVGKLVIAILGDSILNGDHLGENSFPKLLFKNLGDAKYIVANFAVDGACMMKGCDSPYWNTSEYSKAKKMQPNLVVMSFGTNDAKAINWNTTDKHSERMFKRDFIDMIERVQSIKSHPSVFVCIPPPVYCKRCWYDIKQNVVNEELPEVLADVAHRTGAVLVDTFEPLGGRKHKKPLFFFNTTKPHDFTDQFPNDGTFKLCCYVVVGMCTRE